MTYQTTITATRNPRWSVLTSDEGSFGCFGILRLRGSSSPLKKLEKRQRNHDRTPPPRSVLDVPPPSLTDLKGYAISGKSAEILGLTAKGERNASISRTSLPVPWRSLSGNDVSSLRSEVKASSLRSDMSSSSLPMRRWPVLMEDENRNTPAAPLDAVRRRLREQSSTSTIRSSSEPAPTRAHSRKWRKSQRPRPNDIEIHAQRMSEVTAKRSSDDAGKDFLDAASPHATPVREDRVPDTNIFDALIEGLLVPESPAEIEKNSRSSTNIRSAAYNTFAWMEQQSEAMMRLSVSEPSRSSWLFGEEKMPSPIVNAGVQTANGSEKRKIERGHKSFGSMDSSTLGVDRRNTLEWIGVSPRDFPVPVVGVTA